MSVNPSRRKHEEILRLISLYRDQSCLWDNNVEESKSVNARKIALEEIAACMSISSEDVRKKLHNLRSQYRRENLRMRRLKTTRPKWLYYNALKFLGPTIKSRLLNVDPLGSLNDNNKHHSEEMDFNIDIDIDDENTKFEESHFEQRPTRFPNKRQPETEAIDEERHKLSSNSKDASKRIIVIPRQADEQDEYAVFGENVANELRALEYNKSMQHSLKCTILQAILDINKAAYEGATLQNSYEIEETHLVEY